MVAIGRVLVNENLHRTRSKISGGKKKLHYIAGKLIEPREVLEDAFSVVLAEHSCPPHQPLPYHYHRE